MKMFETQVELPGPVKMVAPMFWLDPLALYTSAIAPTENAFPVCFAHMVTFTRAVPIFSYEPWALTTLSPEMLGTVKSCVPELEELDERDGELVACAWVVACAVAVTDGSAAAECAMVGEADGVGDDAGALVSADVGEPAKAADEPVGAPAADAAAEGLDELPPHAARLTPAMATVMITAGTRHSFMLQILR
jgi:hypothetical protein